MTFRCNVCGDTNTCEPAALQREVPSCSGCGSTLRIRAVVGLLSRELFGEALAIDDFPSRKDIRGIGLSDFEGYATRLAARLDYTNTFYDREPRLDITDVPDVLAGTCDFVIASEVFEHVAPPVSRAFAGARRLLKPGGVLIFTAPYVIEVLHTREHFPSLHEWSVRPDAGGGYVLENRRRDGTEERFTDIVFHGGPGSTLEMRLFSRAALMAELAEAGFDAVREASEPMPAVGVVWPVSWSLPIVARASDREAAIPPDSPPAIFVLDDGNEGRFEPVVDVGARWKELPHARSRSRGFMLLPGERLTTDWFRVEAAHRVRLEAMRVIEETSPDGLDLVLDLEIGPRAFPMTQVHLGKEQHFAGAVSVEVSLDAYAGRTARLSLRCLPGAAFDPTGDWAAILSFVLAPLDALSEAAARGQAAWRLQNELSFFTGLYADQFYDSRRPAGGDLAAVRAEIQPIPDGAAPPCAEASEFLATLEPLRPKPGDNAFVFTHRLLGALVERPHLDFAARLRARASEGPRPRVLSLCAGEAHIEALLLQQAGVPVDLTLLDVNPALLERAAARMPASTRVCLWQGSVEALGAGRGEFDVVAFVSGLHHVVRLEHVLSRVATWLAPTGELWIIGEQVGRNGSRLWPEAQRVADRLFRQLPERLRLNHGTGRVDEGMPDVDCAANCFEGIRSEDIPRALTRYFSPLEEHLRDCFLWRFVDVAYAANYDLASDGDVEILRALVAEEFAFYVNGGLGTELNGVYRPKIVRRRGPSIR